jgi:ferredoxin
MPFITLVNENKTLEVTDGANLRKVLLKHGISPYIGKDKILNCRGFGLCGTCRVEVVDGKGVPAMTDREEAALVGLIPFYARKIPKNVRLSCRINVKGDLTVKTYPTIETDREKTRERLMLTLIWTFFGGIFLLVTVLLVLDMVKVV